MPEEALMNHQWWITTRWDERLPARGLGTATLGDGEGAQHLPAHCGAGGDPHAGPGGDPHTNAGLGRADPSWGSLLGQAPSSWSKTDPSWSKQPRYLPVAHLTASGPNLFHLPFLIPPSPTAPGFSP